VAADRAWRSGRPVALSPVRTAGGVPYERRRRRDRRDGGRYGGPP
jgi:hypothetical protein